MAFLLMRFRLLNDMLTPLAIALNAIPIFVLVAVFNNMFSITSEIPRRLMVTLVVYFIVLVNVAKGLRQVEAHPPRAAPVVRRQPVAGAGQGARAQRRAVPVPGAHDRRPCRRHHGLRRRVLRRGQNGLGTRITSNMTANTAAAWAYVLGACLLGLVFYLVSIGLGEHHHTQAGASAPGEEPR